MLSRHLSKFMQSAGIFIAEFRGIYWYEYSGFMTPAYLPHCTPPISVNDAKSIIKLTKRPFVRWTSDFGEPKNSEWWHVIYEGYYTPMNYSSNTRSKINRGKKKLVARCLTANEVLAQGYNVCKHAIIRFNDSSFLPTEDTFIRRVRASIAVPNTMEYFGVFSGEQLVALSENIVQDNAAFWETIWYDPSYLKSYSSYVLTDFMLNHYMNERKFKYVSDGNRSIYHDTSVQEFFISKFGFTKKYAKLNVEYHPLLRIIVYLSCLIKKPLFLLNSKTRWRRLKQVCGLIKQEEIRRSCLK